MSKLQVGILGATGAAGLEFIRALANHPWFEIAELYAHKSSGRRLEEATIFNTADILEHIRNLTVLPSSNISRDLDIICSALPSEEARMLEAECAQYTPVISTASAFRYESDVPIIIPEINADHYRILEQQKKRGWKGWISPGPNCTTVALAIAIAPLYRALGIHSVDMTSLQSVSGVGAEALALFKTQRTLELPSSLNLIEPLATLEPWFDGNVIPYIKGEEEKVRAETGKILGTYVNNQILPASFPIDATCTRVPVTVGHLEVIKIITQKSCSPEDVKALYAEFNHLSKERFGDLPSSPSQTIYVLDRGPQPRYDVNVDSGMATVIGRIENYFGNGIKLIAVSNNLEKGAAKGMIQVAEYLYREGFLRTK